MCFYVCVVLVWWHTYCGWTYSPGGVLTEVQSQLLVTSSIAFYLIFWEMLAHFTLSYPGWLLSPLWSSRLPHSISSTRITGQVLLHPDFIWWQGSKPRSWLCSTYFNSPTLDIWLSEKNLATLHHSIVCVCTKVARGSYVLATIISIYLIYSGIS
jgi:hypothetical protein